MSSLIQVALVQGWAACTRAVFAQRLSEKFALPCCSQQRLQDWDQSLPFQALRLSEPRRPAGVAADPYQPLVMEEGAFSSRRRSRQQ